MRRSLLRNAGEPIDTRYTGLGVLVANAQPPKRPVTSADLLPSYRLPSERSRAYQDHAPSNLGSRFDARA